ncbi:MAG TPA: hypothetical protein VIA80_07930, partial [Hyphomonadaceae bacterium]
MIDVFHRSRRFALLAALLLPLAACALGGSAAVASDGKPVMFPAKGAVNVNPDTQLVLTFASEPKVGTSGLIRIYDAADNSLVDTLDLGIPSSPNPNGRSSAANEAERRAQAAATKMEDFQVNTVGGVGFHFFPIIVRGKTATIYPHNNKLTYGRTYVVKADPGVLSVAGGEFAGAEWKFSTKA